MTTSALQLNKTFVQTSVELGQAMRVLRQQRESLRQQIGKLSVRKMELQLRRASLVVINIQIAEATAAKEKVIKEIDALLTAHTKHLRTHTGR